ncbi:MAG: glycosyltransferase family 39 protein [Anaerolineales bacterium]|nr:glycosyltransferase family 39 protein [Anaerolineales bacterium]
MQTAFELLLLGLILLGGLFRFSWTNWSQGTNLHPDEYGLTNTLTQLSLPENLSDYFNTRLSPLSPYHKYDLDGQKTASGPDNRMRWGQWPIIIIRWTAERTGYTGYNEMRLLGRQLSALADTISLLLIFLIGEKLYNRQVGLLAAALSALAVMQIQQSHFMTVDNFAVCFSTLALYACACIARRPLASRPTSDQASSAPRPYRVDAPSAGWFLLYGIALGMTLASRINLLPLAGMSLIAAWISIAGLRLQQRSDLPRIAFITLLLLSLAAAASLLTFRLTQPMTFRAPSGDTTLLTLHFNQDWLDSMEVAQTESQGIGGGPPAEQWAHRPAIIFPLVNMLLWGMGLPLGIMGWAGYFWAAWRLLSKPHEWQAHLLPLVWVGGYFLFMATRWVKSIRYFLPIYPFLCLLAAWGLVALWQKRASWRGLRRAIPPLVGGVVVLGTLVWAMAFVNAIYRTDHTRIQAARWIFHSIPAPFHLQMQTPEGETSQIPVAAPDYLRIAAPVAYMQPFTPDASGTLQGLLIPHAQALDTGTSATLRVVIALDMNGTQPLDEALVVIQNDWGQPDGVSYQAGFSQAVSLQAGQTYYLIASIAEGGMVMISRNVIANETWDEGLPMGLDGYDPFGQFYRGIALEARWYDDENKRQMYIDVLSEADYIILPSQRAIWSSCRIPRTYPMTMEYYRALFDGRLGFALAASFSAPMKIGPLQISDVGGTFAWGQMPALPLFNHNLLAAEEAFSVYDHPPVWIFAKQPSFDPQAVEQVLSTIDLSQVVVEHPSQSSGKPCR